MFDTGGKRIKEAKELAAHLQAASKGRPKKVSQPQKGDASKQDFIKKKMAKKSSKKKAMKRKWQS